MTMAAVYECAVKRYSALEDHVRLFFTKILSFASVVFRSYRSSNMFISTEWGVAVQFNIYCKFLFKKFHIWTAYKNSLFSMENRHWIAGSITLTLSDVERPEYHTLLMCVFFLESRCPFENLLAASVLRTVRVPANICSWEELTTSLSTFLVSN